MKIHFYDHKTISNLNNRRKLKQFLTHLFEIEGSKIDLINIIFCTDTYLKLLNKKFLNHNYNTDTLTFQDDNLGEIFISLDRIKVNARSYKTNNITELTRVIIHGCLHLCGYKDHPQKNSVKMTLKQETYLRQWNVSRGTKNSQT